MDMPESQNARDARVEELWRKLDPQNKGEINITQLQKGLRKIDHPLKNASPMLNDIVKAMDKNGDKIIQFDEFRVFVEKTEKELLLLFNSIDKDRNGKIDKNELQVAFGKAGLAVPLSKLNRFFAEVDMNHDGFISFDEWRNFLLFLPTNQQTPPLKAVLSYYSSTITMNAEGDTSVSEETLTGLGTSSFLTALFGSIMAISSPSARTARQNSGSTSTSTLPENTNTTTIAGQDTEECCHPKDLNVLVPKNLTYVLGDGQPKKAFEWKKVDFLPDSGYFVCGAVAGVVSRTMTAPLDRLKVFLIANIDTKSMTGQAVKSASAKETAKLVGRPLVMACRELWAAGGIRSMFAGNGINVLKVMPESAIKFGSFEAAKKYFAYLEGHDDPKNIHLVWRFVAGGIGGCMSQLAIYPMDTLKFRMQCMTVKNGLHGNALALAVGKQMWQEGGARSLYRGLTTGLVGMFPYAAIDIFLFESLKAEYATRTARRRGCHEEDAQPGNIATAVFGAFSGSVGASIVYPLNLVRTRLQTQGTVQHPPTYTSAMDVVRKTIANEGPRGLFKGLTPNLIKVIPAVSITWVTYESCKKALHLN